MIHFLENTIAETIERKVKQSHNFYRNLPCDKLCVLKEKKKWLHAVLAKKIVGLFLNNINWWEPEDSDNSTYHHHPSPHLSSLSQKKDTPL